MTLEKLIIKQKLCITLDTNSGDSVIPLFIYTPYAKTGFVIVDEYLEINELKAVAWIYSLTPIIFPVFELEDTESKQLLTAINLEWKSPRIQFDIMCQIGSSTWQKLQAFSLLNPDPYPYREYSLGNHTLGNNAMIGIRIEDVGFGLLQNEDKVTVFADLIKIITLDQPPIIINVTGGTAPTPDPDPDPTPDPDPDPDPTPDPISEDEEMSLKIISADYTLSNRDRVLADISSQKVQNFTLTLPLNPVEGFEVEIICTKNSQYKQIIISAGTLYFLGSPHNLDSVFIDDYHRGGKLLFTQAEGWIAFPGTNPNFAINSGPQ